jgi:hypothetical protein
MVNYNYHQHQIKDFKIHVKKGEHLLLMEHFHGPHVIDYPIHYAITVEDGGHFTHGFWAQEKALELTGHVDVDGDGIYERYFLGKNLLSLNEQWEIFLKGHKSQGLMKNAFMLNHDGVVKLKTKIHHLETHTLSEQQIRAVVDDSAQFYFDGLISVAKKAQKTNARQLSKSLLLSNQAKSQARPQLMISADDVKCSHGSTTGQLNPEEIFYLESRGLKPQRAKELLASAFIMECFKNSPLESEFSL